MANNAFTYVSNSGDLPEVQPLQCDLHPHAAEHQGRTDYDRNDPNRTRRTHEVPFIAGCSHFRRKNTRFRAHVTTSLSHHFPLM